ncbi:MAG: tRNA pseudouridine(13) synthase TruD [Desulfuromonadales bacterium]|nr:tRNA pseudouridine(13) synthase TruD [Desulfuromonadales bacterium]
MTEFLTSQLPGTGGTIRQQPEDFQVDEIPLYEPCGEGDHLYLRVEKCGLTTYDLLRELAGALKCNERDLGYAGLKDARAITRQTVSVPLRKPEDVKGLEIAGVTILSACMHRNKLRPGHLAGNRFQIRVHQPQPEALQRATAILDVLEDIGVPNRFGEQRYGSLGNSHRIGRAILREDYDAALDEIIGDPAEISHPGWQQAVAAYRCGDLETAIEKLPRHCRPERRLLEMIRDGKSPSKAVRAMPRKLLRLYLSAYQSSLFDRLIDMRLGTLNQIWAGDLAYKHINGACFLVTDPEAEQARADAFEISPTAPLFGYKTKLAEGQTGQLEQSLLDAEDLTLESFHLSGGLAMDGERRPLRVPIQAPEASMDGEDLLLSFSLPKGSFATTVLAEVMKAKALD